MTPDVIPANYPFPKVSSSMKKLLVSSILLLMVGLLTTQQQAQAQRVDLAPSLGLGFNVFNQVGDPGSLSFGARSHIYIQEPDSGKTGLALILNPAIDFYLFDIEGISGLQLDGNVLLGFGGRTKFISPYAGLGLALTSVSGEEEPTTVAAFCPGNTTPCTLSDVESGTNIGLNLIGGVLFGNQSPRVFMQLRYTIGEHELHRKNNADPSSGLAFHGGIIFFLRD